MRRHAFALLLLGVAAIFGCRHPQKVGRPIPRVVFLGLDGASWNVLDPLFRAGALPHLAALRDRGVTAELQTVQPVDSPTVWTAIATGRSPAANGVTSFYATWDFLRVPTTWERLAARGLKVGLYDYLVTWPPRPLPSGFVIPGWTRRDGATWPADAFARAGVSPYVYSVGRRFGRAEAAELARRELAEKPRRFNRLAAAYGLDLGVVTFYACDVISHRFWQAAYPGEFPGAPAPDPAERGLVEDTARRADRAVGEILARLGPETAVLVASDHGFMARPDGVRRKWGFDVPDLLATAGFAPGRDGISVVSDWQEVLLRIAPGRPGEAPAAREALLARLVAFLGGIRTPAGAPLFTAVAVHLPLRPAELAGDLPKAFRELTQRETSGYALLLARPDPAALTALWPAGAVTVAGAPRPLARFVHPEDFSGAHAPLGVFFAAGGPFRHLPARTRISVLDLSPLLFHLLGQPIPDDLEGRLPVALLRPEALRAQPPRRIHAIDRGRRGAATQLGEDPELRARLRALGYVD
jgi:hypothetical protein